MPRVDLRMLALWVLAFLGAESIGFGLAFGTGRLVFSALGEPDMLAAEVVIAAVAGVIEGAVLGLGQALVIRRRLSQLPVTWMIGFAIGGAGVVVGPVWLMMGVMGLFLGGLIGAAQARVLAEVHGPTMPWIVANSLGWGVGLLVLTLTLSHGYEGPLAFLAAAFGGLVMALTPAILTGAVVAGLDEPAAQAEGSEGSSAREAISGSSAA